MAGDRSVSVAIRADPRALDPSLRGVRGRFARAGREIAQDLGRSLKGALASLSTVGGFATLGGLAAAARDAIEFNTQLTRLGIAANLTGAAMGHLQKEVLRVSVDTGVAAGDVLSGAQSFVALTGDISTARENMGLFARIAAATGAQMGDIATTAASLKQNLKIDSKDFEQAFSTLIHQGKAGAIEIRDLASQLASVAPQFVRFGNAGTTGLSELGGMLQVVRQGFGDTAQAVTGFEGMLTAFQRRAKQFGKAGLNVYDAKGQLRDVGELVKELDALHINGTKLIELFGRVEGRNAFDILTRKTKDGRYEFEQLAEAASGARDAVTDFERYAASPAAKVQRAWADVRKTLLEVFTPERIEKIAAAIEKLAGLIDWMARNPMKSMAAMMAMKFGPDTIGALITGAAIKTAVAGAGAGAAGAGAAAAGGAAAGGAGAVGAGEAAATTAAFWGPAGLVTGAAAVGVALGTLADRLTGFSDVVGGVKQAKREASEVDATVAMLNKQGGDPTGQVAAMRTKGLLQLTQGFEKEGRANLRAADKLEAQNLDAYRDQNRQAYVKGFAGQESFMRAQGRELVAAARGVGAYDFAAGQRLDPGVLERTGYAETVTDSSRVPIGPGPGPWRGDAPAAPLLAAARQFVEVIVKFDKDAQPVVEKIENHRGKRRH